MNSLGWIDYRRIFDYPVHNLEVWVTDRRFFQGDLFYSGVFEPKGRRIIYKLGFYRTIVPHNLELKQLMLGLEQLR